MQKITKSIVTCLIIGGILLAFSFFVYPLMAQEKHVFLDVPFTSQAPDGAWVLPWSEACEEASLTMLQAYYAGELTLHPSDVKIRMQEMIAWENQAFQKNQDTDAEEIRQLVGHVGTFSVAIQRHPSLQQIIDELRAQRPVIILVDMYALYQEPPKGDSYHVAVLVGFDEVKKQFFVHDPAKQQRMAYSYERVLQALHDYDRQTREGNGTPTVLFTAPLDEVSVQVSQTLMDRIKAWMSHLF